MSKAIAFERSKAINKIDSDHDHNNDHDDDYDTLQLTQQSNNTNNNNNTLTRKQWLDFRYKYNKSWITRYNNAKLTYNYSYNKIILYNKTCYSVITHHIAAYTIQCYYRKYRVRRQVALYNINSNNDYTVLHTTHIHIYTIAALTIQAQYRLYRSTCNSNDDYIMNRSVQVIKNWYKRRVDRKMFNFLKQQIHIAEQLAGYKLLSLIQPGESYILRDKAMLCIVRLRLGCAIDKAHSYPPLIYYKIYTRSNVQDINSYAPRDYVKTTQKQQQHQPNEKGHIIYKRNDNNGWRLLNTALMNSFEIKSKPIKYNYNKQTRIADKQKQLKQNKINWLKKLYYNNNNNVNKTYNNTTATTTNNVNICMAQLDNNINDSNDDSEVNELLNWSQELQLIDYDNYHTQWNITGTSLPV